MRLFEFDDPLVTQIVTVTDQLKNDIEKENVDFDWDVQTLLNYFNRYGITLDTEDLYQMIQKPPLNSVIANIQGDKVVFKGQETASLPKSTSSPQDSKKTVAAMAKKALKK
jgi:hypothetical protein